MQLPRLPAVGEAVSTTTSLTSNAFERSVRDDLSSISRDGFFGHPLRCCFEMMSTRHQSCGRLSRPEDFQMTMFFVADQLLFFRKGVAGIQKLRNWRRREQPGKVSRPRIYFGHGYQLADASLRSKWSNRTTTFPNDRELGPIGLDPGLLGRLGP